MSLHLKLPAVACDNIVNGKEFHSIGTATKNECLNALVVEHTRLEVKECDLVESVLVFCALYSNGNVSLETRDKQNMME